MTPRIKFGHQTFGASILLLAGCAHAPGLRDGVWDGVRTIPEVSGASTEVDMRGIEVTCDPEASPVKLE